MSRGTRPADHRIECGWGDCRSTPPLGLGVCQDHAIEAFHWVRQQMALKIGEMPSWDYDGTQPLTPDPAPKPGLVYAMRFGNLVKIGFTTNLTERRKAIPHDEVIGLAPGTMTNERQVHAILAEYRHLGEWFRYTPEVAAWITEHMPMTP